MAQQIWGDKETQFFYGLTPDRILNTLELHFRDYVCTGLIFALNSMENRVYEIEMEPRDLSSLKERKRLIAKFYRPGRWTKEQILEEHAFLFDLQEQEIPVICPLKFDDGTSLKEMDEANIWFTVFPKYQGRMPDELSFDDLLQVGRLLARMHNVGSLQPSKHRLSLDLATFGYANLSLIMKSPRLPQEIAKTYEDTVQNIFQLIAPLFSGVSQHRIHGDCHFGNLLHGKEGFFWVDFDDMLLGPAVQDIWLLVPGRDAEAKQKLASLMEGYEMMRSFDYNQLKLVEPLRTLRMIHFAAWIDKRWEDPSFKKAFPDFATDKYWHAHLRELLEQQQVIQQVL